MCGICGIVNFEPQPLSTQVLHAMTATLAHRGPDDQGVQVFQSHQLQIGLGHTRLKIIDLSAAASQPMRSEDGAVALVFNGEIYNYRELRASLEARGVRFRTTSDTEVILRLYETAGERCVEQLDGMFAFAVWDGRREQLLIARDRVGKKPLFYYADAARFAFASEIKALAQHPDIPLEVDPASFPAFFMYGYVPTPATFYRHIWKLPPGHRLLMGADRRVRLEEYWSLPAPTPSPRHVLSEEDAIRRLRELLTAAVHRRLIADVPLGAFLSGGIDSSIIVGLMSQLTDEPVRTFSIGFSGDRRFDETRYARLVAERFHTIHTEFVVEPSSIRLIEELVWHHDGPFGDSSAVPTYLLSRLTRQHVTVALNGDGGDELFAGYPRFYATMLSERMPMWVRQRLGRLLQRLPDRDGHPSISHRLRKLGDSLDLPFAERFTRWSSVCFRDLPFLFAEQQDGEAIRQPLAALHPHLERCRDASPLTQLLYLNFRMYLLDDLLVKMDRCSMAHGLEARSPFLDRDLIEFMATLPDHQKLRGTRTKVLLRRAYADFLPSSILTRGKQGFGAPFGTWFRGELGTYLSDILLSPTARFRTYLHAPYVRQLVEEHQQGIRDHSLRLWSLLTFETWLQQLPSWRRPALEPTHVA